jgi:hypothetical protein
MGALTDVVHAAATSTAICASADGPYSYGPMQCVSPVWYNDPAPRVAVNYTTLLTAGYQHVCAQDMLGWLQCWGDNRAGQCTWPPTLHTVLMSITAGSAHTCGILETYHYANHVTCWGSNALGQSTPPATALGTAYASIVAGTEHTCGLSDRGVAICWGRSSEGQTKPPDGVPPFTKLAAGVTFTCGLHADGNVTCFGTGRVVDAAEAVSSVGSVIDIAAGIQHLCALYADHTVACVHEGGGDPGAAVGGTRQLPPVEDVPVAIQRRAAALVGGPQTACAVLDTKALVCWGAMHMREDARFRLPF